MEKQRDSRLMNAVIRIEGLTKEFGTLKAVDDLTVDVYPGGVVGLLGPNGAGKSTTIRMLLALIRPTSGDASILGVSIEHPSRYIERVGALIETPAFYPKLSGNDNMRTLAVLDGQPEARIEKALEIVGLTSRRGDRVSEYSLGMKQRLGIAAALLRDPDILILDEPMNGLDPAGIVEIRTLLKGLAQQGKTILVSSHLLAEVQAVADQVIIINKGRLVFEGDLASLLEEAAHEVVVAPEILDDLTALASVLERAGYELTVEERSIRVVGAVEAPAQLNRLAFDSGISLAELRVHDEDLEAVFLRLTNREMGL
ncbi:MAG: ABC transporter ATP-binding protein [Actinobacteria bacterium]|nr:ABC transporter ATP-binding protein [Actinomycetota bacterium]